MKILMCTPRMGIGGAETHVLTLAEELTRLGNKVTVASSGGVFVPVLKDRGIEHILLPLDNKNPFALLKNLRGLRKAVQNCDIVHAHGRYPAFLCGLLAKKTYFPAFVTTAHGITTNRQPQRYLSRWGEATVSVSDSVTEYLKAQHGVPAEKIRFIPNGVRVSEENTAPPTSADDVFRIAASGRFDKDTAKQFLQLISVTERLCDAGIPARLSLCGSGKKKYALSKASEKSNRKYPGSVLFPGEITDVPAWLKTAGTDVFIGQSRSALEAMAVGIPTVIFSEKGCPGTLSAENAEVLFRNNYMPVNGEEFSNNSGISSQEALFSLLRQLVSDIDLRTRSAAFAQDFVRRHNSLSDVVEETKFFYLDACAKHRPGIVFCGYFGAGNLGDEATLQAVECKAVYVNPEIPRYVLTRTPQAVPSACTGIRRTDFSGIRKAMRNSRLFVLCGGSLLQNSTSNRSLFYYAAMFRAAKKYGCRTQIYAGGIGPLRGKIAEKTAGYILRNIDMASLRDYPSYLLSRKYTIMSYFSADALAATEPVCNYAEEGTYIAVSPRPLAKVKDTERLLDVLQKALGMLLEQTGAVPKYVVLSPEDKPLCERLARTYPGRITVPVTASDAAFLYTACLCTIAVRLHAAILSLSVKTPAICISYDPKVDAFAEEAKFPCFPAASVTPEQLVSAYSHFPSAAVMAETARRQFFRSLLDKQTMLGLYRDGHSTVPYRPQKKQLSDGE